MEPIRYCVSVSAAARRGARRACRWRRTTRARRHARCPAATEGRRPRRCSVASRWCRWRAVTGSTSPSVAGTSASLRGSVLTRSTLGRGSLAWRRPPRQDGTAAPRSPRIGYLDIKIYSGILEPGSRHEQQPERSTRVGLDNHLHAHRRGAGPGHGLAAAHRLGLRQAGRRRGRDARHLARRAASSPRSPTLLTPEQRIGDALAELGALAKTPEANIIKLPNVSASIPQLKAADRRAAGRRATRCPTTPTSPTTDEEKAARARYDKIKGSAVNPVLREGNSDRRAPASVKNYARKHPHSMGAWTADSKTNVATMGADDFRHNEKSVVIAADDTLRIELVGADGTDHRAQGVDPGPRRRGRRRHGHARRRARRLPRRRRSPAPRPRACSSRSTSRPR